MGNGITGGNESVVHALRQVADEMKDSKKVILALDASNAFNTMKREAALDAMHRKVPELYLTALNIYGRPSYTVINDVTTAAEEGSTQGCPMACERSS